ncbi:MAG TPA: porin [Vicinamibacterales bacterium]|nr:porin [Vicinamibacterales bacterium]
MPTSRIAVYIVAFVFAFAAPVRAQVVIKVNEDVNFKFGVLGQFQGDWLEDPDQDETQQNLFIRRVRLLFGGQVARNVTFFIETDAVNLGRTLPGGKNISPQMIVQDAYGEVRLHDALALDVGLMFVPFSRNSIQSAASLLPIDYGAYTFSASGPTQSSVGRDTGVQAKGYLLANRLEYRLGAFQGARDARSHRSFRYAGRVQFQLLDPEPPGFFYSGTYLGNRRVAAVGAAFDTQDEYVAYDADAFVDYPLGPGAVTAQLAYHRLDGDTTFVTLPKQNVVLLEVGYLLRDLRLTPVLQFTRRGVAGTNAGDETRWSIGLNYWWASHNANVKGAYGRIDPRGLSEQNQFTIQLQLFYF